MPGPRVRILVVLQICTQEFIYLVFTAIYRRSRPYLEHDRQEFQLTQVFGMDNSQLALHIGLSYTHIVSYPSGETVGTVTHR
jgi:hypothetical protein